MKKGAKRGCRDPLPKKMGYITLATTGANDPQVCPKLGRSVARSHERIGIGAPSVAVRLESRG